MKELVADFKTIFKKDKGLLVWMMANFGLAVWLFLMPIVNLNPSSKQVFVRYSDLSSYSNSDWWYLTSFSVIAVAIGVGHTLLAARLYSKRGRDISRLFLGISVVILVVAICFLRNIIGEG